MSSSPKRWTSFQIDVFVTYGWDGASISSTKITYLEASQEVTDGDEVRMDDEHSIYTGPFTCHDDLEQAFVWMQGALRKLNILAI